MGQLATGRLHVRAFEEPRRRLRVPDQAVADGYGVVMFGEFHETVRLGEVETTLPGLEGHRLHTVLRRDRVEMYRGEGDFDEGLSLMPPRIIQGDGDEKCVLESLFERSLAPRGPSGLCDR